MPSKTLNEILRENGNEALGTLKAEAEVKRSTVLKDKKRAFAMHLLDGLPITESVFRAGYYVGKDHNNPLYRKRAYQLGYQMMREPAVRDFLVLNAKNPVGKSGTINESAIIDRLMLICMGQVEVKTTYKGKEYFSPPSFRDQVSAGKVLMDIKKMQEKNVPTEKRVDVMKGRVDTLVKSISSAYQLEQIVDEDEVGEESEYEEVNEEKNDEA